MTSVVVGVDSSTQSCTVEVRTADTGDLLGSGRAPHPPTTRPGSEQAPDAWWKAFQSALDSALSSSGVEPKNVGAISIGAQCHGLVLLGSDGEPLRNAKLWNDTTSAPQAERMVADLGADTWADQVGLVPTAAITITKLAWVAEHEPDVLARTARVLLPHDYLMYRLTGEALTDRSSASGTGYYSAATDRWRPDLLRGLVSKDVDWESALPDVCGPSEVAGTVRSDVAAGLGLGPDVLVGPGGGDQHVGAVGLGIEDGDVAYSFGTSGVVLTGSRASVHDARGLVDGVADVTGGYLPLASTLNSTLVTDTFARLLGVGVAELGELALRAPTAADRPVLAAYLDGERCPPLPHARGVLSGITTSISREQLALAAFEGVVAGLVRGHSALKELGVRTDGVVVATGGGARSPAYIQVLADMLGRPVDRREVPESVARGACVQASAVLRGLDVRSVRDAWSPAPLSTTDPRRGTSDVQERYLATADAAAALN